MVETPFRRRDWDYLGWRYSVISSIAVGGLNNVVDMIPARDPEEFRNFSASDIAFFRHWLSWTDLNRKYLLHTRFILGQPAIGKIDGTSALLGARGYVFLFNPNARKLTAEFALNSSVGFSGKGQFLVEEVYPRKGLLIGKPGAGFWQAGDRVSIPMEGATALVLNISPVRPPLAQSFVFNAPGKAQMAAGTLSLVGVQGAYGSTAPLLVLLPAARKISAATVNGVPVKFVQKGSLVSLPVEFAGNLFTHSEQIGEFDPQFAGGTFRARFRIPKRIFDQLAARQKAWPIPWTAEDLRTTWLAPQRLLLFVQIAQPDEKMRLSLNIGGKPV
ncbi:MAG: hypothetical protein ACRD4M_12850, partial [Candidatus Acidiferrales bacterium]